MALSKQKSEFNSKPIVNYQLGMQIDKTKTIRLHSRVYEGDAKIVELLKDLVDTKQSEQLEEVVIGAWQNAYETGPKDSLDFLIENKIQFPNLKHIFIGDMSYMDCEMSWIYQTNYEEFLAAYSHLETLGVQGSAMLRFGKTRLPQLKSLFVYSGGLSREFFDDIILMEAPGIESIELWIGTEEYGRSTTVDQIKQLLDKSMPNLTHLGLQNAENQNEIVQAVVTHPIIKQLKTVDFSMGILDDEGGQYLLDKSIELEHLEHINCRRHYLSDEMISKLKAQFGDRINLDDQEEPIDFGEYEEPYKYVEVGE